MLKTNPRKNKGLGMRVSMRYSRRMIIFIVPKWVYRDKNTVRIFFREYLSVVGGDSTVV